MAKAIGTLGNIDTISIGGRVFTDLTNLIMLYTYIQNGGAAQYGTFRKAGGTTGYTPSGGLTFKFSAARISQLATTLNGTGSFTVGYSDNDMGFAGTSPTNGKYIANSSAAYYFGVTTLASGNAGLIEEAVMDFVCPNTKFPFALYVPASLNASVQAFGYEV